MATSPSHKLGELIGDFFEFAIIAYLAPIVRKEGYYLDYRHPRPARNNQREVIGIDHEGNKHKLDIVVEEGGTERRFGVPRAFIEMAWRRYKKHSKNKVQEIAGAIRPLVETYAKEMPFYAAVLAGEFTDNSLIQLKSQGFFVLYFTYEQICDLFATEGISLQWEEDTEDEEFYRIIDAFPDTEDPRYHRLQRTFFRMYRSELAELSDALLNSLSNSISEVLVVPIHGSIYSLNSVHDAISFIMNYDESTHQPILRYEIIVRYRNGDEYTMKCADKRKAIHFLNQYT